MDENFCYNCMNVTDGNIPCSECGNSGIVNNELPALQTGTVLNKKYLIGRCLGKGGFGITYLAYDLSLKSRVAIKEYLPRQIATRTFDDTTVQPTKEDAETYKYGLKRFLEEAQMLRKFNYQSIITVYTCFKENNTAYFDMPFISGKTLEEYVVEQKGISEEELLYIMKHILKGLETVHRKKIYHRDIKPANIYIPHEGYPLLLDFGAARQDMLNKSQTFSIFLTHGYAPFEQYTSRASQGPYTDIYACAATMYSCLRGYINKKGHLIPPPSAPDREKGESLPHIKEVCPNISDRLTNAIMEGLELKPEKRPQSVSEFRKMIDIGGDDSEVWKKPKNYDLLVLAGEFSGERIPLSSKPIIIGRSPKKSALILTNDTISSTHCQIHSVEGVVYVKDLKSKNGTWINDAIRLKSSEIVRVRIGDMISLGGCAVFQVVEASSTEQIFMPRSEPVLTPETNYTKPVSNPTHTSVVADYAGFWKRFGALLIDCVPIFIVYIILESIFRYDKIGATDFTIGDIIQIFIVWIYYAGMESSSKQATLGKLACGLIVTDLNSRRISFLRATARHFGKIISSTILFIGFIMAGFTVKKQAFHDMIAGCFVIIKKEI